MPGRSAVSLVLDSCLASERDGAFIVRLRSVACFAAPLCRPVVTRRSRARTAHPARYACQRLALHGCPGL